MEQMSKEREDVRIRAICDIAGGVRALQSDLSKGYAMWVVAATVAEMPDPPKADREISLSVLAFKDAANKVLLKMAKAQKA